MANLIVVNITENEKTILNNSLLQKQISGHGKILLKNSSQISNLWNIDCDLKELVNTSIESRDIIIDLLNPNQEYVKEYEILQLKYSSLKFSEEFDPNSGKLKIILTNKLKIPITNIKFTGTMSTDFQDNIELIKPKLGDARIEEDKGLVIWDILTLEGNQREELEVYTKEGSPFKPSEVTYLVNSYKLTLLNPELRGSTDSDSKITCNNGNCKIEFTNKSDFQIKLEDVKITNTVNSRIETIVSQTPNKLLNPNEKWEYNFETESDSELDSTIEFTPLFIVINRVIGEIRKE